MTDIAEWLKIYTEQVKRAFGGRVCFLGLQGSFARGEATERSDIDVVLILEKLEKSDLNIYRDTLDQLPCRDLICGFIAGREELLVWESSDLFQFYYDTVPVFGTLDFILGKIDGAAVARAVRTGAGNVYHACVHNFLHEQSEEVVRAAYKSAVFAIQAAAFARTGIYYRRTAELLSAAAPREKRILETARALKRGGIVDLDAATSNLLEWAKEALGEFKQ